MKFSLPDSLIRRIADDIGYFPDSECSHLGDGGVCKEALREDFEVQAPCLVESGSI